MHPSISLAEEALDLARRELSLLEEGNIEEVETIAEKRMQLLDDAWAQRTDDCVTQLQERLEVMRVIQKQMIGKAQAFHDTLAKDLKDIRRRGTRQKSYQQACSNPYSDIPMYISRRS